MSDNNMANLKNSIEAQMEANTAGLKWGRTFVKSEGYETLREKLITNRIRLRRVRYAAGVNPAAAVFGESQVGKSYLVDNILKSSRGPLSVYDGHGREYSFIDEINPIGGGKEATSLITRFTAAQKWTNDDYPVAVHLLKPVDIVLTLCDTFFNDVDLQDEDTPDREAVNAFIEGLERKYSGKDAVQDHITEDELYEMKQYFTSGVLKSCQTFSYNLRQARFFERVASLVRSVDVDQWVEIFSYLWNGNAIFNDVFTRLVRCCRSLGFHETVHIKMDALLREYGTILHVDRLYELFGIQTYAVGNDVITVEAASVPDMEVWTGDSRVKMSKSEFCALSAEVVLKVDKHVAQEKEFLGGLDILDFPGARSRDSIRPESITSAIACGLLIRGKVAYLFNMYSQQFLISNLLFCHHKEQSNVKTLAGLLEGWVKGMVGDTPEKRAGFMKHAEVAPLFMVATKFNIDLKKTPLDFSPIEKTREDAVNGRWTTRFDNMANLIGRQTKWLNDWVSDDGGRTLPFRNFYLLRAYNYSCLDGIYKGYLDDKGGLNTDAGGKVVGEQEVTGDYYDFLHRLRETFMQNKFVQQHFASPEVSWDKAVSPYDYKPLSPDSPDYQAELRSHSKVSGQVDGSDWIIENLTKSSRSTARLRQYQFESLVSSSLDTLCTELGRHFHDENSDAALKEAFSQSGRITISMDVLFGQDKYFFSEFIDRLTVREDELNDKILDTIKSNVVIEDTDLSELFAIRNRAGINPAIGEDENRRRIRSTYHFGSDKELDDWLTSRKLTMEMIINPPKVRNLAAIIVDEVSDFWLSGYLTLDRFGDFVSRGMSGADLECLLRKLNALFCTKLNVPEKMTYAVHRLVTSQDHLEDMSEMIADICSEMINKFINTAGTAYFHDGLWEQIRETASHNGFELKSGGGYDDTVTVDATDVRNSLPSIFDIFDNVDTILNQVPVDEDKLGRFSNYHFYREWTDNMKMAFLATCDIPTYDVLANNELRDILLNSILKVPALGGMIGDGDYEKYHFTSIRALA